MAGARGILTAPPYQTPARVTGQSKAAVTRAAKAAAHLKTTTDIVQTLVDRKRGYVSVKDISALAKVTGTPKLEILRIVETARETFSQGALEYVNIHKDATALALSLGGDDPKYLDVATRASQWAIEKISHDGARVIEKDVKAEGTGGTRIMIGINLGGKNPTYADVDPVIEAEKA